MTDQDLMWDLLSDNHGKLAHVWGQELAALSKRRNKKQFRARADECLSSTLSWPVEARARAVKTWLSTYKIPLNPAEMASSDQFHQTTANFVFSNRESIRSYE